MRESLTGLLAGLYGAIVLVILLIVVNFNPGLTLHHHHGAARRALAGIICFWFFYTPTISVPALMGAIMCMGVATANSILVVALPKEKLAEHGSAVEAALEAGSTRFRPVLMTAFAMITA